MQQAYAFLFGIILLILGIPIGNILAKKTKEELKDGRKWFRVLIITSLIFAVLFLVLENDALFFTMLFIAIVTSRSLKR